MKQDNNRTIVGMARNVVVLGVVSLFTDLSSQMIFPLLPLFFANVLGINKSLIGLIEGVAESTASLLKVFSGWLSDRLGRRKSIVFAGYALSTLSKPFFALSTTWLHALGTRFIERVGKGIRTSPRDALIAAASEEGGRGKTYGFHRMMDRVGAVGGVILAYLLLAWTNQNFRQIFLIATIPGLLAVLAILLVREPRARGERTALPTLSLGLFDRRFKLFIAIAVLFALGNFSYAFLVLRAEEMGVRVGTIPLVYLTYNIVSALFSMPAGALSDRLGRRKVLAMGYGTFGLVSLGFVVTQAPIYAWALFAFYGVYHAIYEGVSRAFAADLAPADLRGTALGVYHTAVGLATLPASYIGGTLWHAFGSAATFSYGAVLALLAALLLLIGLRG